jgi:hypothetical protein
VEPVEAATVEPRAGTIRVLAEGDGDQVLTLVKNMLLTYGFRWDPEGLDADVLAPDRYLQDGGTFLVLERDGHIMGTIAGRRLDRERLELCRISENAGRARFVDRALALCARLALGLTLISTRRTDPAPGPG